MLGLETSFLESATALSKSDMLGWVVGFGECVGLWRGEVTFAREQAGGYVCRGGRTEKEKESRGSRCSVELMHPRGWDSVPFGGAVER